MSCLCSCEEYKLKSCTIENTKWLNFKGQKKFMKVIDVYDGDTITVAMYISGTKYLEKIRLYGINAPEIRGDVDKEKGGKSKDRLKELILGKTVYVHCGDWDKYGRLLGTIYLKSYSRTSINKMLLNEGHAVEYK